VAYTYIDIGGYRNADTWHEGSTQSSCLCYPYSVCCILHILDLGTPRYNISVTVDASLENRVLHLLQEINGRSES